MRDASYKSAKSLIHYLLDNVSKNGYLLLNVGPKPDGSIPTEAKRVLLEMGEWLEINGEAVYDTTSWRAAEEGPTRMTSSGAFCEMDEVEYTQRDIRYTMKDHNIYATALGKLKKQVVLHKILPMVYADEIESISILGENKPLKWKVDGGTLIIETGDGGTNDIANVLKITRKIIFK